MDPLVSSRLYDNWLRQSIRELRDMSLLERMKGLKEMKVEFDSSTSAVIDSIEEKVAKATSIRNKAAEGHHAYYDGLIGEFEESFKAVDLLANTVPLDGGNATNGSVEPPPFPVEPVQPSASMSSPVSVARPAYGGSRI